MARKKADNPRLKPEQIVGTVRYTRRVTYAPGVNLRVEPTLTADVLRVLRYNEDVEPDVNADAPEGWIAVKGGGYCMGKYLK